MALVKVISKNLFAGANFQRLGIGSNVEVSDEVADRWVAAGLAELMAERKMEVATPKRGRKPKSEG